MNGEMVMQTYITKKNIAEHIKQQTSDKSCVNHLPNSVYSQKISENSVSGLENALKSRIAQNHMSPEKALYSLNSHERHVSPDLQNRLNNKFGADMHGIRIFEDDQLHEDFGQRAYAKGNEIHISNGEYSPDTPSGLELIMHEAGHVIQQGSGMVHSHGITENPALEAQADRGFIAPSSFSMPTVSDSSPIQGWAPWDKFKKWLSRKNSAEPPAIAENIGKDTDIPTSVEATEKAADVPQAAEAAEKAADVPQAAEAVEKAADVPQSAEAIEKAADVPQAAEAAEKAADVPQAAEAVEKAADVPQAAEAVEKAADVPQAAEAAEKAADESTNSTPETQIPEVTNNEPQPSWLKKIANNIVRTKVEKAHRNAWNIKAVFNGIKRICNKLLNIGGLADKHHSAVDQLNNFRKDYEKMSLGSRFIWTCCNPLARIFAGAEADGTKRRNQEAQLMAETEGHNLNPVENEDIKPFDVNEAFKNTAPNNVNSSVNSGLINGEGIADIVGKVSAAAGAGTSVFANNGLSVIQDGASLGAKDFKLNESSGFLNAATSLVGAVNSGTQTYKEFKNGNHADAINNGLSTIANTSDTVGQALRISANIGQNIDKIKYFDSKVIPGLDITSGAVNAIRGLTEFSSAKSTENAMKKRLSSGMDRSSVFYKAADMANNKAGINKKQGEFDMLTGALKATGGALKLSGVASLAGATASGIGTAVNIYGGFITDQMKREMRAKLVDQETGLNEKIAEYAAAHNCDQYMAKRIILRSMGYQSGKRKEVFNNIVMNRAAKMKKLADSGDKEAISFMKDIGLSKKENEDGKGETFSLQGIAEKLGMENNDTWENQLEQSKKYRIYDRSNPFLPKTTGGA